MGEIVDTDARQGRLEVTVVGEGPSWWLDRARRVLGHIVVVGLEVVGVMLSDESHRLSALAPGAATGEAQFKVRWTGFLIG